jgi:hypothetical protein
MTNIRDSEGLSASDKMEMNLSKIDKGLVDTAEINIDLSIKRLRKEIDVPITEEEISYQMNNQRSADIQVHLIRSIYSALFMSYRDQYLTPRHESVILLLLLKKKLILEAGYQDANDMRQGVVLPYILSGNFSGKVNNRMVRNSKLLANIEEDPDYQYLVTKKYRWLEERFPGYIKGIISSFIYTQFTYVCYEAPELLGKPIVASEDQIAHELIQFLKGI